MTENRGPWGDSFDQGGRPLCAGKSLLQMMEDRLDELMWDLMMAQATGQRSPALIGEARGVTTCIALVRTPYAPQEEPVKAAAMERYQERLRALTG